MRLKEVIRIVGCLGWIVYTSPGTSLFARDVLTLFDEALADSTPTRSELYKSVSGTDLSAHIFVPEKGHESKQAGILWIHGGGWKGGSADQLFPHAAYFAKLGYLCISIDYRLAELDGATIFDGIEDCRDAFYWMVAHAEELGIDPGKIVVAGESAGGHLAACVGYIEDPRSTGIPSPQPWPVATVPINPIMDLTDTAIPWAMQVPGLTPDDVELAESISPLYHIGSSDPPALLLHGAADSVVPPAQSREFVDAMHPLGNIANLRIWEGKGHAFFLYLPEYDLLDKPIIHLSLLEIEAFLQSLKLNGYPEIHGHFAPIHLFDGTDGFRSFSELTAIGDRLYGSTYLGGANNKGVVFSFDPVTRDYDLLHEFDGTDGREVFTGLAFDGNRLYGVGKFGGNDDGGTLFSMNLDGTGFSVLHHFDKADDSGFYPHAAPVLVDGVLYGTTYHGGTTTWGGALYKFPLPAGPYELIHSFETATGRHPTGQLIQIGDWLYGMASDLFQHAGGHYGSLFRIRTTDYSFELLHTFNGSTEGSHPYDDLLSDGVDNLYGTTFGEAGNPASKGTIFSYSISGDSLTVLHDFAARSGTGSKPNSALIRIDDSGRLYGITHGSNASGGDVGTLFSIGTDGTDFHVYHVFDTGMNGNTPMRSLTYLSGAFFGVTAFGGLTTDMTNVETGPGFIFRYQPIALSAPKLAYIDWLSGDDLLINQCPDGDLDQDDLSLVEEFSHRGNALIPEPRPISGLDRSLSGGLMIEFPIIRRDMKDAFVPLESTDLANWSPNEDFSMSSFPAAELPELFDSVTFEWPATRIAMDPLFVQFSVSLPQ